MCAVCKNSACSLSHQSHDGIVLHGLIHTLEANDATNVTPAPEIIARLRELAQRIYQSGPHCSVCGQPMLRRTGPTEPDQVNYFLSNIELLMNYGVL